MEATWATETIGCAAFCEAALPRKQWYFMLVIRRVWHLGARSCDPVFRMEIHRLRFYVMSLIQRRAQKLSETSQFQTEEEKDFMEPFKLSGALKCHALKCSGNLTSLCGKSPAKKGGFKAFSALPCAQITNSSRVQTGEWGWGDGAVDRALVLHAAHPASFPASPLVVP